MTDFTSVIVFARQRIGKRLSVIRACCLNMRWAILLRRTMVGRVKGSMGSTFLAGEAAVAVHWLAYNARVRMRLTMVASSLKRSYGAR